MRTWQLQRAFTSRRKDLILAVLLWLRPAVRVQSTLSKSPAGCTFLESSLRLLRVPDPASGCWPHRRASTVHGQTRVCWPTQTGKKSHVPSRGYAASQTQNYNSLGRTPLNGGLAPTCVTTVKVRTSV